MATTAEIDNLASTCMNYYIERDASLMQHIMDKPLLKILKETKKTFPGGLDIVDTAIFETVSTLQGYTGSDQVTYSNPKVAKQCRYQWKEFHIGLTVERTELLKNGIMLDDSNIPGSTVISKSDTVRLVNSLENKLRDVFEGDALGMWAMFWGDGTSDPKAVAGIGAFITDDPRTGIVGTLDICLRGEPGGQLRLLLHQYTHYQVFTCAFKPSLHDRIVGETSGQCLCQRSASGQFAAQQLLKRGVIRQSSSTRLLG